MIDMSELNNIKTQKAIATKMLCISHRLNKRAYMQPKKQTMKYMNCKGGKMKVIKHVPG